jgi:hypothetical protein
MSKPTVGPQRIQRRRTKGWKMPPNTVYVGRPSVFGNPFETSLPEDRLRVRNLFRLWLEGAKGTGGCGLRRIKLMFRMRELRGKNLACWCPLDQPCHADVLLELAND